MAETTLEKVKLSIRRSHSKLDEDIQDDIAACLADLRACGIVHTRAEESDPLMLSAIKLYCKSTNTDDPAKSAEFLARYEKQKAFLMTCEGYGRAVDDDVFD